jgi:hypothetical protein
MPLMAAAMVFSPSSFPQTPNKVSERERKKHKRHEPLKIMALFGIQTSPKARVSLAVSRPSLPDPGYQQGH